MPRPLETTRSSSEPHLPWPDDRQQYACVWRAQVQEKAAAHRVLERKHVWRAHDRRSGEEVQLFQHAWIRKPNRQHHRHARRRHGGGGTASQLVNGSAANEFWWNGGSGATLTFDLGTAKVIKQARWKQSNSSTHGTFKWQGSNDGTTYSDIGGTFTLGGATVQVHTSLIDNATAYRYYRLTQTAGSTSNSPFLQEVEFYIEGATKDLPDGSYRYPCGGGSDVGGDVSGVGGSGVDRSSLITVTAGYSVASAGQNAQNWVDGARRQQHQRIRSTSRRVRPRSPSRSTSMPRARSIASSASRSVKAMAPVRAPTRSRLRMTTRVGRRSRPASPG